MKKYLFFVFLLTLPLTTYSWWDTPHMAAAQIAYERLEPQVKEKVDILTRKFGAPFHKSRDFISAACWPDDIAADGLRALSSWHFSDIPYDPDHHLSQEKYDNFLKMQEGKDVLFAIAQAQVTLKNPHATSWTKGFMLRYLTHCVADAHQPMHSTILFSKEFPLGDAGGNFFSIDWEGGKPNLHSFWDSCCGIEMPHLHRPLDQKGIAELNAFVEQIVKEFPEKSLEEVDDLNTLHWRQESYDLAVKYAYQGIELGKKPSPEYTKRGQEICKKQIALAGYRLAKILNTLFR